MKLEDVDDQAFILPDDDTIPANFAQRDEDGDISADVESDAGDETDSKMPRSRHQQSPIFIQVRLPAPPIFVVLVAGLCWTTCTPIS